MRCPRYSLSPFEIQQAFKVAAFRLHSIPYAPPLAWLVAEEVRVRSFEEVRGRGQGQVFRCNSVVKQGALDVRHAQCAANSMVNCTLRKNSMTIQESARMSSKGPGFAVLYRWRLHEDADASFVKAWTRVSELLLSERGSLGSRLHRGPDGLWYSYAQWQACLCDFIQRKR